MPRVRRPVVRYAAPLVTLPVLAASLAGCASQLRAPAQGWHLGWRAETVFPATSSITTTCRFVTRLTGSGSQVRIELTSGTKLSYTVQSAYAGTPTSLQSLDVVPGSTQQLRFAGRPSVLVTPNAPVYSDPLPRTVRPNDGLSVTVTAGRGDASTKGISVEPGGCTNGAPAPTGAEPGRTFNQASRPRWVRSVLVDGPAQRSIVAFGDSITEGPGGYYVRWSDQLAAAGLDVVNAGVGGGAISTTGMFGTMPGIDRARQVLAEPNVTDLALLIGTNDLGFGISGNAVLASLDTVISEARQHGIAVYVGTILPRSGFGWTPAREAQRAFVNSQLRGAWLQTRGATLIDTDAAMRDPAKPTQLLPAYNSGDGLHPNVVGSARLGKAFLSVMAPLTPAPAPSKVAPSSAAPSPSSPVPSSPAPSSPVPSSVPTSAAPTSPAPSSPAPTSAAPTSPAPAVPAPTPTPTPTPSDVPTPAPTPTDAPVLPVLDPVTAELDPQTSSYLKYRAIAPDAYAQWGW